MVATVVPVNAAPRLRPEPKEHDGGADGDHYQVTRNYSILPKTGLVVEPMPPLRTLSCVQSYRQVASWYWVGLVANTRHKERVSQTLSLVQTNKALATILCQTIHLAVTDRRPETPKQIQNWNEEVNYLANELSGLFDWEGENDWMVMEYLELSKAPLQRFLTHFDKYVANVDNEMPWLQEHHQETPMALKVVHQRSRFLLESYCSMESMQNIATNAVQMHDQLGFKVLLAFLNIFIAVSQYVRTHWAY